MSKSFVHATTDVQATDSDPGNDPFAAASMEVYSRTNELYLTDPYSPGCAWCTK